MTNNDVLKRIRYTFELNDAQVVKLFSLGGSKVTTDMVISWTNKEDDENFMILEDIDLAIVLNGFIISRRGARPDSPPTPEKIMNNNLILKKIKIALALTTEDIIEMYIMIDKQIGMHELNACLRNPKQNQYRIFQDQYLRQFMNSVQHKFRPKKIKENIEKTED